MYDKGYTGWLACIIILSQIVYNQSHIITEVHIVKKRYVSIENQSTLISCYLRVLLPKGTSKFLETVFLMTLTTQWSLFLPRRLVVIDIKSRSPGS
jgi:hypothetical protein